VDLPFVGHAYDHSCLHTHVDHVCVQVCQACVDQTYVNHANILHRTHADAEQVIGQPNLHPQTYVDHAYV